MDSFLIFKSESELYQNTGTEFYVDLPFNILEKLTNKSSAGWKISLFDIFIDGITDKLDLIVYCDICEESYIFGKYLRLLGYTKSSYCTPLYIPISNIKRKIKFEIRNLKDNIAPQNIKLKTVIIVLNIRYNP
jgi:rhodanese-related sulfurtransferase